MSLLNIEGLPHSFGENVLYKNAEISLNKGEHIGVVGQNGTGKSTLIKICTEQIMPDAGRVVWQPNISVGYLDQYAEIEKEMTMESFLRSAFGALYKMEEEMTAAYDKAARGPMVWGCRQQAITIRFYPGQIPALQGCYKFSDQVATGHFEQDLIWEDAVRTPILDEPTNHLDHQAKDALKAALSEFSGTILLVSHEETFYSEWAQRVIDIEKQN